MQPSNARVAKMKDGRRHLAHKAEHAVDLDTGAVVAVTLQGADKGDTTTLHETLCEAGMTVAELAGREAELRPIDTPKVNVNWIEELADDKGYHSGVVVTRVKNYKRCAATFRRRSRRGGATGRATPKRSRRSIRIGGGCAAATARACSGDAVNWSNAASRIAMKPAA
jgi:transposase